MKKFLGNTLLALTVIFTILLAADKKVDAKQEETVQYTIKYDGGIIVANIPIDKYDEFIYLINNDEEFLNKFIYGENEEVHIQGNEWAAPEDGKAEYYLGYKIFDRGYFYRSGVRRLYDMYTYEGKFDKELRSIGTLAVVKELMDFGGVPGKIASQLSGIGIDYLRDIRDREFSDLIFDVVEGKYFRIMVTTVYDPYWGYRTYLEGQR